jgi:uncharacterized membrane protein
MMAASLAALGGALPLAQAVETHVREFTWLHPIPAWVFFLVVVPLALGFVGFVYRRERPGSEGSSAPAGKPAARGRIMRRVLTGIRVLVLLSLVALIAEPVLRTTKYQNLDASILVLVDDSLSMDVADKYSNRDLLQKLADFYRSTPETMESTTRYDLVWRLLRDGDIGLLEALRAKGKVVVSSFARSLRRVKDIPKKRPEDAPLDEAARDVLPRYDLVRTDERTRETRISDAVLDAVSSERGGGLGAIENRIAAVLLFSDGQQTVGARPIEDVARRLGQRGIPIFAVGIGNPDEPRDIRAAGLDVSDIVLAGDRVPFDAAIIAEGFEGERVRVDLKIDSDVVDTEYVLLEGKGRRQSVRLEYRPPRPGEFVATVEVERRSGELFTDNNTVSKPIRVLDQKIRVLYAEGPPRWEYRYLKNALIRDATMEAQVFLFSADKSFIQESSPGIPALAEFPRTREALFSYHVIILGDVDIERRLTAEEISLLKEFVSEAGGGLVFIAGDNANPWKYTDTDLYALLPVEVPERGSMPPVPSPITSAFNVELTPVGKEHTVLRLDNDPEQNARLWENKDGKVLEHLPGFYWFAEVGPAKKGAVVLARHPTKVHPVDQRGLVVLAFMNYGKGRTFFSGVDNTWRWRAGVDNQYFYRFWGQVIRFAATGRLLGKTPRFRVTTDKPEYTLGENVDIEARVFDAEMKPSTEKSVTVHHQARADDAQGTDKLELDLSPVEGQGAYRGAMVANRLGLHELWLGTENERLAFTSFEVAVPALEMKDPRRNQSFLDVAAKESGGAFFEVPDVLKAVERIQGESRARQGDITDDPIWDDLWVLLLFTGLIATEWILRKMVHLL